ncbi:hypothetical protein V1477_002440 [Vespula maculifrons]|uniref:Uncharacterized protein n=1 Tax=Vespula maculifrons TaxID=7453 RepID=A0ABD2CXZ4_VESMC
MNRRETRSPAVPWPCILRGEKSPEGEEASRNQVILWFHASRLTFVVQVYPSGDFLVTSRRTYPPTNYTDTVQVLASSLDTDIHKA